MASERGSVTRHFYPAPVSRNGNVRTMDRRSPTVQREACAVLLDDHPTSL
jgi:hypothetical protein